MKIYTLTLNPAYDVHAFAESFAACHENLAQILSREAGGKGVNISRALAGNGVPNTAVIILGTENGGEFRQALAGMDCICLEKEGRIRENLTLHSPNAPETRISFTGFSVDAQTLTQVERVMNIDEDTVVTFTGRIPAGISIAAAKVFLNGLRERGAKLVLDSKSFSVEDVLELKPWLIKPNQEEISQWFSCRIDTVKQAARAAKTFADYGVVNVMVSLGEQGALLLHDGKTWVAAPPVIEAVSTIGAGDSTIAGFMAAAGAGKRPEECLRTAVAYGTAACLTQGSQPPEREAVAGILHQIRLTNLG